MGLCAGTQYGRLIMNAESFAGKHRLINVPANGEYSNYLKYGRFEETEESGKYVVGKWFADLSEMTLLL